VNEPGCHAFEGKHMLAAGREFLERVVSFVQATLPNGFDGAPKRRLFSCAS